MVKNSPAMRETWVQSLGWKDPSAYVKTKALIASLMAQLVKNLPAVQETLVQFLGRSTGEGIGYPLQYSWASLVAQLVKNPPAMWETWV